MKTARLPDTTTRQRILDTSMELFSAQGFAGTSVRKIAREVGLTQSSLYNHFASKDAIFDALIDHSGTGASAQLLQTPRYLVLKSDPARFCETYALDRMQSWLDPYEQKFLDLMTAEKSRLGTRADQYFDALFLGEVSLVTDYFHQFAIAGLIRTSDAKETARLFMGGLGYIRLDHLLMTTKPSSPEVIRDAVLRNVRNFVLLISP
jgi:AcrR family transcriptional regulator